jgi:hypothetical protein
MYDMVVVNLSKTAIHGILQDNRVMEIVSARWPLHGGHEKAINSLLYVSKEMPQNFQLY